MLKINISSTPIDHNHDFHCPIPLLLKADPDINKDASDTQTLDAFRMVPKGVPLLLKGSGDPACLADQVAMVLRKNNWPEVSVDRTRDDQRYSNQCKSWPDLRRPWFHVDSSCFVDDINRFFKIYDCVPRVPDIPVNNISGHYPRGPKTRTEINLAYDLTTSPNPELMTAMRSLFDIMSPWWLDQLKEHGLDFQLEPERVTLRMVEYKNNGHDLDYKSHIDSSVITILIYHDAPDLHVREYLDDEFSYSASREISVSHLADKGIGTVIPGHLFSDEFGVWMPSCWHGVHTPKSVPRRRSLILRIEPRDLEKKMSYPVG
jgi:hypothetical protein